MSLTEDEIGLIRRAHGRCSASEGFVDTFYDLLINRSPEIKALFANTEKEQQIIILKSGLSMLVMFARGGLVLRDSFEELVTRHDRNHMNIKPEYYEHWISAMIEAAAMHDSEFSGEVEELWQKTLTIGVDYMVSKY